MKEYPTISKDPQHGFLYGFDKLDGSNIRAEWSRKSGFCKFGRRHGLLDGTNPILERAPDLIRSKYEKGLTDIFKRQRFDRVVAFFEFWGKNSFAGNHDVNETQDVTLFDVSVDKKGFLEPKEFVKLFSEVDTARLLYKDLQKRASITEDKCIPNYLECLDACYDLYRKAAEEELEKGKGKE